MSYLPEILQYLQWPVLIIVSYYAIKWAINKFEKNNNVNEE